MFDIPRTSFGGDTYVLLEYSVDFEFEANFRVNLVAEMIRDSNIDGVIEVIPSIVGLMVHYNPDLIPPQSLVKRLQEVAEDAKRADVTRITSRFIELPVLFNDPWSLDCQKQFQSYHNTGDVPNIKFVAKENGISIREVIARFLRPQWWIVFIGFTPGLWWSAPVGVRQDEILHASKYVKPRTSTPAGTVSIGGIYYANYSVTHPGGYQLLGRTPAPITVYDERCNPEKPLEPFLERPILNKTSDRIRVRPVSPEEYEDISQQVKEGEYKYLIREQSFDTTRYSEDPVSYILDLERSVDYNYNIEERIDMASSRFEGVG